VHKPRATFTVFTVSIKSFTLDNRQIWGGEDLLFVAYIAGPGVTLGPILLVTK